MLTGADQSSLVESIALRKRGNNPKCEEQTEGEQVTTGIYFKLSMPVHLANLTTFLQDSTSYA